MLVRDRHGVAVNSHFDTTDTNVAVVVDDALAAYPLTIDPTWSQQVYLKASNTGATDRFGTSVAVSGDTVVIGAFLEASNATGVNGDQTNNSVQEAGAAYVFVGTSVSDQTITFNALATKTFGDAAFAVSASATSSLAVAFSSTTTGVCTVSSATVTLVAAGTCTIAADQAGDSNYNAAPQVTRSFTVAKANQTITFGALSDKTFGDAAFAVSAAAGSGLAVTFSSTTTYDLVVYAQSTVTGTFNQYRVMRVIVQWPQLTADRRRPPARFDTNPSLGLS